MEVTQTSFSEIETLLITILMMQVSPASRLTPYFACKIKGVNLFPIQRRKVRENWNTGEHLLNWKFYASDTRGDISWKFYYLSVIGIQTMKPWGCLCWSYVLVYFTVPSKLALEGRQDKTSDTNTTGARPQQRCWWYQFWVRKITYVLSPNGTTVICFGQCETRIISASSIIYTQSAWSAGNSSKYCFLVVNWDTPESEDLTVFNKYISVKGLYCSPVITHWSCFDLTGSMLQTRMIHGWEYKSFTAIAICMGQCGALGMLN